MQDTNEFALEEMIDKLGLSRVVELLSSVCWAKSQHVEDNWQDKELSKLWSRNARLLEKAQLKVENV